MVYLVFEVGLPAMHDSSTMISLCAAVAACFEVGAAAGKGAVADGDEVRVYVSG